MLSVRLPGSGSPSVIRLHLSRPEKSKSMRIEYLYKRSAGRFAWGGCPICDPNPYSGRRVGSIFPVTLKKN